MPGYCAILFLDVAVGVEEAVGWTISLANSCKVLGLGMCINVCFLQAIIRIWKPD